MSRFFLSCMVFAFAGIGVQADEPSKAAVKKLAQALSEATVASEYAKVVDQMYPPAVKMLGGRDLAIVLLEATMKQAKAQGVYVTKIEDGEPGEFYTEGGNTFVVIPTSLETKFPEGKRCDKSYSLGISDDNGKTWKFLDGAGLQNEALRDKVLPKMPAKLKLPEKVKSQTVYDK